METWPGTTYPLGATFDGSGTNFALFSEAAQRVELCLIDEDGGETRVEVRESSAFIWHCYLPLVQPGQPEQAAARPLRQGDHRGYRLGSVAVLLRLR